MIPGAYTTIGPVRGRCGHAHRTVTTAARCAHVDQAACARRGGYSDRYVVRGDSEPLDAEEYEEYWAFEMDGR